MLLNNYNNLIVFRFVARSFFPHHILFNHFFYLYFVSLLFVLFSHISSSVHISYCFSNATHCIHSFIFFQQILLIIHLTYLPLYLECFIFPLFFCLSIENLYLFFVSIQIPSFFFYSFVAGLNSAQPILFLIFYLFNFFMLFFHKFVSSVLIFLTYVPL